MLLAPGFFSSGLQSPELHLVEVELRGGHGYPSEWIEAIAALEDLDFEQVVPGHGRVHRGTEQLRLVRRLFTSIRDQAAAAAAAGADLEETKKRVDLESDDPAAQRAFDGFMPETVERAWLEASASKRHCRPALVICTDRGGLVGMMDTSSPRSEDVVPVEIDAIEALRGSGRGQGLTKRLLEERARDRERGS